MRACVCVRVLYGVVLLPLGICVSVCVCICVCAYHYLYVSECISERIYVCV